MHGFLYSVRLKWCVGRREGDFVTYLKFSLSSETKPCRSSRSLLSSTVTLGCLLSSKVPHGGRLYLPPDVKRSLMFFLLLLELLDGVHLRPGGHLAHLGRVLALHHQLIGHVIVFLQRRERRGKNAQSFKKSLRKGASSTAKSSSQGQSHTLIRNWKATI